MKTLASLICICLLSITTFASNPELETVEPTEIKETAATAQELEFQRVIQNILKEESPFCNDTTPKCKIIILDNNFRTIRAESLEKMEDVCNQSTLVPIIYRSVFITKINQVSYFMLQKNNF